MRLSPCHHRIFLVWICSTLTVLSLLGISSVDALVTPSTTIATRNKILVLGSNGFVGQEVVKQLQELEIPYVAIGGRNELDLTSVGGQQQVTDLCLQEDCTAVISTVGSLMGTSEDLKINSANKIAALGARDAPTVKQFVTIGNDPKTRRSVVGQSVLKDYTEGKIISETAIRECFPDGYTIVCPSLIHGSDAFSLNPPRIPGNVGQIAEDLLGLYPIQSASDALPGLLGVALGAPISKERVAKACINAALGLVATHDLDTRDDILKAASIRPQKVLHALPPSTASSEETEDTATVVAGDLKQQLYDLGDCGGQPDKLEVAFDLLEQIENCNVRQPTTDTTLNGRWEFCMDVEADIGTGVLKDILLGKDTSPIKAVFELKDLYMTIENNRLINIHVNTKLAGGLLPIDLKLTTELLADDSDPTGTTFLEQFQGIEIGGQKFPIPNDWQRSRPLEFSYLDDTMLIARGNGAEPHYLKRSAP